MDGIARVSVSAEASGDAPLVSPLPMDMDDPPTSSGGANLFAPRSDGSTQSCQVASPKGSPERLTEASVAQQQETNKVELPMTPETASSSSPQRSGSDGAPTPSESETGAQNSGVEGANSLQTDKGEECGVLETQESGQKTGNEATGETNGAVAVAAAPVPVMMPKRWFEVIPMVLQNFKTHNQEQIRQLALSQCIVCKLRQKTQRAEVTCRDEDCKLSARPLCASCWDISHSTDEKKNHRQLLTAMCQQCQLDRISFWCVECDLKFCRVCFDRIHSVAKSKSHRRLATEDAPGSCLVQSDWSETFQNTILQMIAIKKHPGRASDSSGGDSIGGKRKRDVEVIVIDDDTSDGSNAQFSPAVNNGVSGQQSSNYDPSPQNGVNTGTKHVGAENALSRIDELFSQTQVPQSNAPASILSQPHLVPNFTMEPIPFPGTASSSAGFAVQTSSAFTASPTSNGNNTANINTNGENGQWNNGITQFTTSASVGLAGFTTSVGSSEMMEVTPTSMPASASMANGVWSTNSAISTDVASNLLPLGGAVFAENALVDSLIDRYHEMNQNVTTMEMQGEQLTRQIAIATCQGPYAAASIMVMVNTLQPVLEAARARRDNFLIAMIIQSNDIMAAVRLLRLSELGDVPQVPMISHRKCLQISNEINQHKKKLLELNQQLSETLNQSNAVNLSWENTLILTTSTSIQKHEKSIQSLKKNREVEIVRIVQFSNGIREKLKAAFQRTVEIQRQRQERDQQQQQCQRYG